MKEYRDIKVDGINYTWKFDNKFGYKNVTLLILKNKKVIYSDTTDKNWNPKLMTDNIKQIIRSLFIHYNERK